MQRCVGEIVTLTAIVPIVSAHVFIFTFPNTYDLEGAREGGFYYAPPLKKKGANCYPTSVRSSLHLTLRYTSEQIVGKSIAVEHPSRNLVTPN